MRKKGAVSTLRRERAEDIYRAYLNLPGDGGPGSWRMADVCRRVVNMPSRRFWVSPRRAAEVVGRLLRGEGAGVMRGERLRMFEEIASRTAAMMGGCGGGGMPLLYAVERVVLEPAPCFYLSAESARKILIEQCRRARQRAAGRKMRREP